MSDFTTPAANFTQAEWDTLPLWERELLTPVTAPVVVLHRVAEWVILENSDTESKIIYRWPADLDGRREIEREYDRNGFGFDPTKCFCKITYWNDEPQVWEVEGGLYF